MRKRTVRKTVMWVWALPFLVDEKNEIFLLFIKKQIYSFQRSNFKINFSADMRSEDKAKISVS